jgi:hypothetical protein
MQIVHKVVAFFFFLACTYRQNNGPTVRPMDKQTKKRTQTIITTILKRDTNQLQPSGQPTNQPFPLPKIDRTRTHGSVRSNEWMNAGHIKNGPIACQESWEKETSGTRYRTATYDTCTESITSKMSMMVPVRYPSSCYLSLLTRCLSGTFLFFFFFFFFFFLAKVVTTTWCRQTVAVKCIFVYSSRLIWCIGWIACSRRAALFIFHLNFFFLVCTPNLMFLCVPSPSVVHFILH